MKWLIPLVLGVATASAGAYLLLPRVAPKTAAALESVARDSLGWDEEACVRLPGPCLRAKFEQLGSVERDFDRSIGALRREMGRLSEVVDTRRALLAGNEALLREGRALHQGGLPENAAVDFAGRSYPSRRSFEGQLALLYGERTSLESLVEEASDLEVRLGERLEQLQLRRGEVRAARELIPGKVRVIEANGLLTDLHEQVESIDELVRASGDPEQEVAELVGTTRELMETARRSASAGEDGRVLPPGFEAFLREGLEGSAAEEE